MESAFARLYRTSKLASFDPKIKQVYTTFSEAATHGDWGLKRTMPSKVHTRLVTIGSLDTKEQITPFESANQQVMMVNAWKENFPESRSPRSAPASNSMFSATLSRFDGEQAEEADAKSSGPVRNIGLMTRKQWEEFLDEARARRGEWKQAVKDGKVVVEEALSFMNATNMRNTSEDGIHNSPTYHDYVPASEELQVQGRVLNRAAGGYAVAVQGIIAYLPLPSHSAEEGFQYRDVKTFYVASAKFDSHGKPDVILSTRPRGTRESALVFETGSRGGFSYSKGRNAKPSELQSAYLGRIKELLHSSNMAGVTKKGGAKTKPTDPVADAIDLLNKPDRK